MNKFISGIASAMVAMQDYREALGYSRQSHESSLMNFDRYLSAHHPKAVSISKVMVHDWLDREARKPRSNLTGKATTIRLLGQYLSAVGQKAYILPKGYASRHQAFTPYIFTDNELSRLFRAIDTLPSNSLDPTAPVVMPVLFRMTYTCGLRPGEGRELRREHINFDTGEIFITKTKRKKERIVVMSDDMLGLCWEYDARLDSLSCKSEFFFPRQNGQEYTESQIDRIFKKSWELANSTVKPSNLPDVRVYDLRHRFATAVFHRWIDCGKNLYAMLPYLRAYMGHDNMSDTAYYIHILPENLVKSSGIDWAAFDALIPEVNVWPG